MNAYERVRADIHEMRRLALSKDIRSSDVKYRRRIEELSDGIELITEPFMGPALESNKWSRFGLTKCERRIADLLLRRFGQAVHRGALLTAMAFDSPQEPDVKIIDVFICKIRQKFTRHKYENAIQTEWGIGFKMVKTEALIPLRERFNSPLRKALEAA